jgi:hypothetical protein
MFALVYTKSTLFPLEILDFFNEFLKSGIRWNEPQNCVGVLVVEEAGENHRPWASNCQTLSLAAAS